MLASRLRLALGADVATRKCFGCNQDLAKVEFSKRQWVKRVGRECKACVVGRVEAEGKVGRLSKTYTEMLSRNCVFWLKWHGDPGREPPTSMELSVFNRISQEDWRVILEGKELEAWPAVELSIHKQALAVAVGNCHERFVDPHAQAATLGEVKLPGDWILTDTDSETGDKSLSRKEILELFGCGYSSEEPEEYGFDYEGELQRQAEMDYLSVLHPDSCGF